MLKRMGVVALASAVASSALIGGLAGTGSGQDSPAVALVVKVGPKAYPYTVEQLKPMATLAIPNFRGDDKRPAIPLETLLTRDTKLPMSRITAVVVAGEMKVLLVEGDNLKYIKDLALKFGGNHISLTATTDEASEGLRPLWGKARVENVERIDILTNTFMQKK